MPIDNQAPEEISFGEWLHQRRRMLDLSQQALADQVGCARITLRRIEAGALKPSKELALILLEKLNVPSEEHEAWLRFARGLSGFPERSVDSFARKPITNLPSSLTGFIGREKELDEITKLIAKNRLLTLTGAGGIGKTRLSLETAHKIFSDFPDGVWFIELAPLSDPAFVPQAVVNTLGLIEQSDRSPVSILTDFLRMKRALLILDNCEHLIQACAQLAEALLHHCPDLHILATSREALGIAGETLYLVPPLMIPDSPHVALESLSDYEAVQLFVERAQSALAGFMFTQDNAPAIAQICHQLDGIPLALELAAARVKALRVEEIAARLNDRFRLLTGGTRTALPRHQTLRAMIDWSHDLLTESERVLLRRLSVFAGSWTLEAAESVCAGDGIESHEILDLLTQLVNKSLILAKREQGKEIRYQVLETIRQYAREKLWAAGEGEMLRQRHLAYFVDLAERAEPNLRAFDMVMWLDRLETELGNIRAALTWALESNIEAQLRLASALLWFWHIRGHRYEGIDWLEEGLSIEAMERGDRPIIPGRAMIRGKALNASGMLRGESAVGKVAERFEESRALFEALGPAGEQGMAYALLGLAGWTGTMTQKALLEQSLPLFREVGDKFGTAECLMYLAGNAQIDDDYEQAVVFVEEQLALSREIGDQDGIASALWNLGDLAFYWQDNYQRTIALYEEGLTGFRAVRNKRAIGFGLSTFADVCLWQGDYERAAKTYEEGLAFAQELGDRVLIAINIYNLGTMAWLRGDYARATQMITDSLAVFRDLGHLWLVASSLHALGDIALAQGDDQRAAQWYEAELTLGREEQLDMSLIFALGGLGKVAWLKGDYDLAGKRFEEGLSLSRKAGLKIAMFQALYGLGRVAQSLGDNAAARASYMEALEIRRHRISLTFNRSWLKTYVAAVAYPLSALAALAAAQNRMERAARLLGALGPLYHFIQFQQLPAERAEHDQAVAAVRAALGDEAFTAAWAEGKAMTMEQAVAYAISED